MPGILCGLTLLAVAVARPASQGSASTYTVYTTTARRAVPSHASGGTDYMALSDLAPVFGLAMAEDALVNGLTIQTRGQAILLIPGQSFASIGPGRIVSLPAVVQHDRGGWQVPVDFLHLVLGPALGVRVDVRRPSREVLVGDVRLPQITARIERTGSGARVTFELDSTAPHRATREGNRMVIRFDAVAVDLAPVTGLIPEFVGGVRAEGTALTIDLGPSSATARADDTDATHIVLDLQPPGAPPPPTLPVVPQNLTPPAIDLTPPGTIRTIVLDPGHGGDDEGAHGGQGTKEKDITLQIARRLKTAIESRIGLRVLLTREGDDNVPLDRRTAFANNNKADLLISLHANASFNPATHGVTVMSADVDNYTRTADPASLAASPVPVPGGPPRLITVVPWDLAQIPYAAKSATFSALIAQRLTERNVALYTPPDSRLPLRVLLGANMPAVMVEVGFLTNEDDEHQLAGTDRPTLIVDALVATIDDVRRGVAALNVPEARP